MIVKKKPIKILKAYTYCKNILKMYKVFLKNITLGYNKFDNNSFLHNPQIKQLKKSVGH